MVKSYIKQADCIVLAYDISDDRTFRSCQKWLELVDELERECSVIMVGNKSDLGRKTSIK